MKLNNSTPTYINRPQSATARDPHAGSARLPHLPVRQWKRAGAELQAASPTTALSTTSTTTTAAAAAATTLCNEFSESLFSGKQSSFSDGSCKIISTGRICQLMPFQQQFSRFIESNEVDCSLTHAVGLVDSISYVASRSKKSSKLGLKMALYAGAIWAVYFI